MVLQNIQFILRRFNRQKLTTSLHIVGLTLGITVCLLIGLFIKYELSFDTYESKADRTYRINPYLVDAISSVGFAFIGVKAQFIFNE